MKTTTTIEMFDRELLIDMNRLLETYLFLLEMFQLQKIKLLDQTEEE